MFPIEVAAHEPRRLAHVDPPQVVQHEHLPVGADARADANGGKRHFRGDAGGQLRWHALEHDREAAQIGQRVRLTKQSCRVHIVSALHAEAAELVDRLRRQPDVTHDGHAGSDDLSDHILVAVDAFELDRLRPARHQRAHRRHRRWYAFPERQEGKIGNHELSCSRASDRAGVQGHEIDGRPKRRRLTVHDHRGRISHENGVHVRTRNDASRPGVIGGDDGDLPTLRFEAGEIVNGVHKLRVGLRRARSGTMRRTGGPEGVR